MSSRARKRPIRPEDHGKHAGYDKGCRCLPCVEFHRKYQREWKQETTWRNKTEFFEDKSCVVCGATIELVIHHRDPEKKIDHNIWTWAAEKREAELAKCDVLCQFHHRSHHTKLLHEQGRIPKQRRWV